MHAPERVKLANWDREMAIDLRGTFLVCREPGGRMARARARRDRQCRVRLGYIQASGAQRLAMRRRKPGMVSARSSAGDRMPTIASQ
jgi:NAD(P)-dependent dehydrogenase (short-subunit alcohol dehydrogenase family)